MAGKAGICYANPPNESNIIPLPVSETPQLSPRLGLCLAIRCPKLTRSNLQIQLKAAFADLNPAAEETYEYFSARMHQLRAKPINGMMILLQYWNEKTSAYGEPVFPALLPPWENSAPRIHQALISVRSGTSPISL